MADIELDGNTGKLIELLEAAHGHALAGSIVPLRAAEADLRPSVEVSHRARQMVKEQLVDLNGAKPTPARYRKAILDALAKILEG